jgi:zinc D-Ala-D-Ala carboxypeptidase
MQLSKNFSLTELTKSQEAIRKGLDNTPSPVVIANLLTLVCMLLQPLRDKVGPIIASSGYRSEAVNTAIGGSKTSDHMYGQAADIESTSISNLELAHLIVKNFKFTQVILEFYVEGDPNSGWVHVSYDKNNLKCQTLTAVKRNGKTVYLPGLPKL